MIAGGIAVDDPDQMAVVQHQVGIAVLAQKRRQARDAVADVAPDHDAAAVDDVAGHQQIDIAVEVAEQQAASETADRHAAAALVV